MLKAFYVSLLTVLILIGTDANALVRRTVRGDGNVVQEKRQIDPFRELIIKGNFNVILMQGTRVRVAMEGEENLLREIISHSDDHVLTLGTREGVTLKPKQPLTIFITIDDLEKLDFSGALKVSSQSPLQLEILSLNLDGANKISLNLILETFNLNSKGMSKVTIKGRTYEQSLRATGSLFYDAREFNTAVMDVQMIGAGEVFLNVQEKLNIAVAGVSTIKYMPYPALELTTAIAGKASVSAIK